MYILLAPALRHSQALLLQVMFSSKGLGALTHARVLLRSIRPCSLPQTASLSGSSIKVIKTTWSSSCESETLLAIVPSGCFQGPIVAISYRTRTGRS